MSPRAGRLLRWGLSLAVLALLVAMARTVDWGTCWAAVRRGSPAGLLLALLLNTLSFAAAGLAWWLFLQPFGRVSVGLALRSALAGAALNNLLVANAGEAARVVFVTRGGAVRGDQAAAALALERVVHVLAYLVLAIGGLFLLPMPAALARWRMGVAAAFAILLALLVLLVSRRAGGAGDGDEASPRGLVGRIRAALARFAASASGAATPGRVALAFALQGAHWALQLATYHLAARALHLPISVAGSLAVLLTVNIGFAVRATPGNVGVFQLVYAATAAAMGVPRSPAVAVGLVLQALQAVPITLVGALLAPEFVFRKRNQPAAPAVP